MYADQRYTAPGVRPGSLAAAFAVNGAILLGLIYAAPNILPGERPGAIPVINIKEVPIPPPLPVETPKPQVERQAREPVSTPPVAPDPIVQTPNQQVIETTPRIPEFATTLPPADRTGPAPVEPVVEKPRPPALVPASPDPRYADGFQPQYPASEIRAEREGTVTVRVRIGPDGRVTEVERIDAASDAFFEATRRQALSKWRFKPATRGGVAEASWKTMKVYFRLDQR
ncbi:MAG: TonB family protein [Pseudomonadota bacterium]